MRADRLISILMILQERGKVPARELAEMLEVSQRTIYRDIEALSIAGIPVYTERGPEGGCLLVEDYRSDLTGLTSDEWGALLLLNAPSPLDDLGVGEKIRSAFRKLMAASTKTSGVATQRPTEIHLDWTNWHTQTEGTEPLGILYRAARAGKKVHLCFTWREDMRIELVVGILGFVAKAGDWYLVCMLQGKIRTFRIADLQEVSPVDEPFTPPEGFHLSQYWQIVCRDQEAFQVRYKVIVRTTAGITGMLKRRFGQRIKTIPNLDETRPAGNIRDRFFEISFESFESALEKLIAYGGALEVLEPTPLRLAIHDYAQQIQKVYDETA